MNTIAIKPDNEIDPITFEVLRSIFEYASDRMATILQRSSFSPILADMLDFSNAIYDADLRLVSQAANCPVHLAAMKFSAEAAVSHIGLENIKEGDVLLVNDPYRGGTHINDISFIKPYYYEHELIGFGVSRGHWMDLGGGGAGGQAFSTHIAAEGLRLPPLKIFSEGKINQDVLAIILNNTRTPHFVKGDLQAHLGCLKGAEEELLRACDRYEVGTVKKAMRHIRAYTEKIIKNSILDIPNGIYEAEDYADTDGISSERVKIKVKLVVEDEKIIVDFDGSDPICQGAINSPYANTVSAALYSLQFFLAPDVPQNQGMFDPIEVRIPENCWLNARWPAPTIGCTTLTSSKITSAIWQALAQAIPEKVTGSACADANWFVASCIAPDGKMDVFSDLPAGGWGGTPFNDGMSVTMDPLGNCMNMPAETAELFFPIAYEAFELRKDSAGAGLHRGGLGAVFQVRFVGGGELGMETARTLEGSPGAAGGLSSALQRSTHVHADGRTDVIGGFDENGNWINPLLSSHKFGAQESFMFESTGGGGWGNPLKRPVEQVLDDVLDEYISVEAAKKYYGVSINPETLTINVEETSQLRRVA